MQFDPCSVLTIVLHVYIGWGTLNCHQIYRKAVHRITTLGSVIDTGALARVLVNWMRKNCFLLPIPCTGKLFKEPGVVAKVCTCMARLNFCMILQLSRIGAAAVISIYIMF